MQLIFLSPQKKENKNLPGQHKSEQQTKKRVQNKNISQQIKRVVMTAKKAIKVATLTTY